MKENVTVYRLIDIDQDNEIVCYGSINDICHWAKNRWEQDAERIKAEYGFKIEEEFYAFLDDNNTNLHEFLKEMGYEAESICEIPIEDFQE
jgi:hypothetical protein